MCLIEKIFLKFFSNYKSVRAVDRKGGGGGGGGQFAPKLGLYWQNLSRGAPDVATY